MKFVDYGDFVEVTFDNGDIQLLTPENAKIYGYKPKQDIQIAYNGTTYNSSQFAKLTGISEATIRSYYSKGLRTGEEITAAYKTSIIKISYNGTEYTTLQFAKLTGISDTFIRTCYSKGLCTGEEIIATYNEHKSSVIKITYNGTDYTTLQLARLTGISNAFIRKCYSQGLHTGEEIITAYNEYKSSMIMIPYDGTEYTTGRFAELIGISSQAVRDYYSKGLHTGEEIITAYNEYKSSIIKIPYNGTAYSVKQFVELTDISLSAVRDYYSKGLHTGEEIITVYNKNKSSIIKISYNGTEYTLPQFAKLTGISLGTIRDYYSKNLTTGEEIITAYDEYKSSLIKISYNGTAYSVKQFAELTSVPENTVRKYYSKNLHTGEEIIAAYNKNKSSVIKIPYNGAEYTLP